LPVVWGADGVGSTVTRDPEYWAQTYEGAGLSDMFSKIKALAENSSQHRIVGCGLKVWVSRDATTVSLGNIEGGHFKVSRSRFRGPSSMVSRRSVAFDYKNTGLYGTALNYPTVANMRSSIESAKNQRLGFLPAEEGCTVRWTDSNDFQYIDTNYRSLVAPSKTFYVNGYVPFIATHNYPPNVADGFPDVGYAGRVLHDVDLVTPEEALATYNTFYYVPTSFTGANANGDPTLFSVGTGRLGTFRRCPDANTAGGSFGANGVGTVKGEFFASADASLFPEVKAWENNIDWISDEGNFGNSLYADVSGVSVGSKLTVQIVWHVEYIPSYQALDTGIPSPVDTNFDSLAVMAGDDVSFPIVVKGHSFFKSLLRGLRQAASGASRILGIASNVAKFVPLPQVQAFGMGAGSASMIASGISGALQ
jgi:hypothetical protein